VPDSLQQIINLSSPRNSENTDLYERRAVEGAYRLTVMPAVALATGIWPYGGAVGTTLGVANMWAGSRDAQESMSDAVFGPEPEKAGKKKKEK